MIHCLGIGNRRQRVLYMDIQRIPFVGQQRWPWDSYLSTRCKGRISALRIPPHEDCLVRYRVSQGKPIKCACRYFFNTHLQVVVPSSSESCSSHKDDEDQQHRNTCPEFFCL